MTKFLFQNPHFSFLRIGCLLRKFSDDLTRVPTGMLASVPDFATIFSPLTVNAISPSRMLKEITATKTAPMVDVGPRDL